MLHAIQKLVLSVDAAIASASLAVRQEKPGLLAFLFHSIFRDECEVSQHVVDPLERTTTASLRELISYYRKLNYRFVSESDLAAGLQATDRCVLLSFDDGYANNLFALPILEEFQVPANFFISTAHVRDQKSYWWDVLYRQRMARNVSLREIYHEAVALKQNTTDVIEQKLVELFGADCLWPRGEIDRPFTAAELRDFAKHPLVTIGNHTDNHAILTNYSEDGARRQLETSQQWLADTLGHRPRAIAYPNGAYNDSIINLCRAVGLSIGFTVRPRKNMLPLARDSAGGMFRISRFCPNGHAPIARQCRAFRSDLNMYSGLRDVYLKYARGQTAQ